jgi:hypothetical protein
MLRFFISRVTEVVGEITPFLEKICPRNPALFVFKGHFYGAREAPLVSGLAYPIVAGFANHHGGAIHVDLESS